jgi:hypothetical protein
LGRLLKSAPAFRLVTSCKISTSLQTGGQTPQESPALAVNLFIHHFILRLMHLQFSFERMWMSLFLFISSKPQLKSWGWFFNLRLASWAGFSKIAPAFRLVVKRDK